MDIWPSRISLCWAAACAADKLWLMSVIRMTCPGLPRPTLSHLDLIALELAIRRIGVEGDHEHRLSQPGRRIICRSYQLMAITPRKYLGSVYSRCKCRRVRNLFANKLNKQPLMEIGNTFRSYDWGWGRTGEGCLFYSNDHIITMNWRICRADCVGRLIYNQVAFD